MRQSPDYCVLILEDEPLIALELAQALTDRGIGSVVALDIPRARALLEEREFHGAIIDISSVRNPQPDLMCDALLEHSVPFVVYSGYPYPSSAAVALITKPADPEKVAQTLLDAIMYLPPSHAKGPDNASHSGS